LARRVYEHKNKLVDGFTKKYNIDKLAYCECFASIIDAIVREKQLKKWERAWKIRMIEQSNPNWDDLYKTLI